MFKLDRKLSHWTLRGKFDKDLYTSKRQLLRFSWYEAENCVEL